MRALTAFLKTLARRGGRRGFQTRTTVQLTDGKSLDGIVVGRTARELQLRTDDQHIHLLRKAGESIASPPRSPIGRASTAASAATAIRR